MFMFIPLVVSVAAIIANSIALVNLIYENNSKQMKGKSKSSAKSSKKGKLKKDTASEFNVSRVIEQQDVETQSVLISGNDSTLETVQQKTCDKKESDMSSTLNLKRVSRKNKLTFRNLGASSTASMAHFSPNISVKPVSSTYVVSKRLRNLEDSRYNSKSKVRTSSITTSTPPNVSVQSTSDVLVKDVACIDDKEKFAVNTAPEKRVVESEDSLESKCLQQGAKPKSGTISVTHLSRTQKILTSNIVPGSERSNIFSVRNKESFTTSIESRSLLVQSRSMSSGLCLQNLNYGYGLDDNQYKAVREKIKLCNNTLKELKKLHSVYCIRLINLIFGIENEKVIVFDEIKKFLSRYTRNTELLIFVLKVSLIINLSSIYGGKKWINHIRYCVTHFYDQSLLDNIILDLIKCIKSEGHVCYAVRIFSTHCGGLCNRSTYEPYSGKFYQEILNICYDFALVNECGEYKELVNFIEWSCMIYCGHMVGMLCNMLIHDSGVEKMEDRNLIKNRMKASVFCELCYNLKNAAVHTYYSYEKGNPRNVAGLIDIPLVIWRRCSIEIHETVKNYVNEEGELSFGVFIENMIIPAKRMILKDFTKYYYMENIRMYESKLKTAGSMLLL